MPAPACNATTLAPTEFTSCTASHTVDHSDLYAGYVDHRGLHSFPTRRSSDLEPTDSATAFATQSPAATLDKVISGGDPYAAVGDVVSYGYTLTNTIERTHI